VTELARWGRSMLDLFHTLQDMQAWDVSLVAQTGGLQFDLRSAQGKLIASLMAALAEFERDLLREKVRSGIAAARKWGRVWPAAGSACQGSPFRAQSAETGQRRTVVSRNQPPTRTQQEYRSRTVVGRLRGGTRRRRSAAGDN
jgi:DNA invertase Pin-like site-specific DNA recombinase